MTDLTLVLIVGGSALMLAAFFKGRLDAIADEDIKGFEWEKKYDLTRSKRNHWWYFGWYKPAHPERFPFSSTALVFLTDKWHFNQFMMLKCYQGLIAFFISGNLFTWFLFTFIIFPFINGLIFEMTYNPYRKKLRKRYYNTQTPSYNTKSKWEWEPEGDEPQQEQITSVPEKQIEDELH
jgi:hypothetical protein